MRALIISLLSGCTAATGPEQPTATDTGSVTTPPWTAAGHSSAEIHIVYDPPGDNDPTLEYSFELVNTDPNTGGNPDVVEVNENRYHPEAQDLIVGYGACAGGGVDDIGLPDRPLVFVFFSNIEVDYDGTLGWAELAMEPDAPCDNGDTPLLCQAFQSTYEIPIYLVTEMDDSGNGTIEGTLLCFDRDDNVNGVLYIDGSFDITE